MNPVPPSTQIRPASDVAAAGAADAITGSESRASRCRGGSAARTLPGLRWRAGTRPRSRRACGPRPTITSFVRRPRCAAGLPSATLRISTPPWPSTMSAPSSPGCAPPALRFGHGVAFADDGRDAARLAVAQQRDVDLLADAQQADRVAQTAGVLDRAAVDGRDDVAGLDAGLFGRRAFDHLRDERALRVVGDPCFARCRASASGCSRRARRA